MLIENQIDNITLILGDPVFRGQTICVWKINRSEFSVLVTLKRKFKVLLYVSDGKICIDYASFEYSKFGDVLEVAKNFKKLAEENDEDNS